MIDSWFLKSIIRKKYAFPNSYQEKVPKEVFLLWAKIRFEVFQSSKSQEINNERRVFYQLHIWNGLRPRDICSGNSQGHDLDFQLVEATGIIWNVLTMAAPGVPGDLLRSRKSPLQGPAPAKWHSVLLPPQSEGNQDRGVSIPQCRPPVLRAASLITAPLCGEKGR